MGLYNEIEGDLIKLALEGKFDVITHGCNCFCTMGAGIAPQMAKAFGVDKLFLEAPIYKGDINRLGLIDYFERPTKLENGNELVVINSYTQYGFGANHEGGTDVPLDYSALALCLKKINHIFKGNHIGLPQIGCGLAGGDWVRVKALIQTCLKDCTVTVVIYKG